MKLSDNEKSIDELAKITITNRRIIFSKDDELKVIPISQFSMAIAAFISYPWLLGVGGVFGLFSSIMLINGNTSEAQSYGTTGMAIALVSIVLYFVTRGFKIEIYRIVE